MTCYYEVRAGWHPGWTHPLERLEMLKMSDDVTRWIRRLADGDELAAQRIWERYFEDLTRLARKRLAGLPRRAADEEDVALSAMNSFYRGALAGRFPQLSDREDLWKLLVTITARKATAQRRRHYGYRPLNDITYDRRITP